MLKNLTDTTKAHLDGLAINFNCIYHQKYRTAFLKTNFAPGLTNFKNIRVSEWVGILYLLDSYIGAKQTCMASY